MWTDRTELLLGAAKMEMLSAARVVVVGIGGVGAYAAEMLVRAGIGHLKIVDSDTVGQTNINRQLLALHSTVGLPKTEVLSARLMDINPKLDLCCEQVYVNEENMAAVVGECDYVVDAIDTLSPKVALVQYCLGAGIPLVSAMGAGAKTDATQVRLSDISRTRECPLAHQLRKRLHKLGIYEGFQAVYSEERPAVESVIMEESRNKKSQVGTISYLPAVFGCVCAQAVILGLSRK